MNAKRAVLAAAAAALFTAGISATSQVASADSHEKGETVHCKGVNGCKGQTDCGGVGHDCSGKNSCKGKGWKKMTADECEKAKAAMDA